MRLLNILRLLYAYCALAQARAAPPERTKPQSTREEVESLHERLLAAMQAQAVRQASAWRSAVAAESSAARGPGRALEATEDAVAVCREDGPGFSFCNTELDVPGYGRQMCASIVGYLSSFAAAHKPLWKAGCCTQSCAETCPGLAAPSPKGVCVKATTCVPTDAPPVPDWCVEQQPWGNGTLHGECQVCSLNSSVVVPRYKALRLSRDPASQIGDAIITANYKFSHFVVYGELMLTNLVLKEGRAHVQFAWPIGYSLQMFRCGKYKCKASPLTWDLDKAKRSCHLFAPNFPCHSNTFVGPECLLTNNSNVSDPNCLVNAFTGYHTTNVNETLTHGGAIHVSRVSTGVTLDSVHIMDSSALGYGGE